MKKIALALLVLLPFLSHAQSAGNDTTLYIYYKFTYGNALDRYWAKKVMKIPTDTTFSKDGLAMKGGVLYVGNGIKWTLVAGGGGFSLSDTGYTKTLASPALLQKTIDSMKIVNAGLYRTILDTAYAHLLASRNGLYKVSDSLAADYIARLLAKRDVLDTAFAHLLMTRAWGYKISDSIFGIVNAALAGKVTNLGGSSGMNRGAFLSRPSASSAANTYWWSTDSVFFSYSDGTSWKDLKPGTGEGSSVTVVPQGPIQSFTGTGVDTLAVATEIGMTFNKSSFSSISTDFPTNTGSFTTSSGHIVTGTGTALDTTKYISLPDVGYGNRWIKGYIMIAPTKTATSPSPQVGVRSLVSTFIASQLGWVDLSTGADAGKTFYQGKGVAATKSTMALSWLAGDSILVYTKRYDDSLWVTAINIMAARRSIATLEYTFTSSGSASLENKGVTTIWTQGDPVSIVNVFALCHDLKYANTMWGMDSKGQLYNASSFKKVFTNQLLDFYGTGVNYGQTGAKIQDLIDEEPDIFIHHPKQFIIQVGCNDVGALSAYQTNVVLFYNWCKANGIRPIVMSVTWESARNLDAMYVWQSDPSRPWVIDGNWIDVYNITRASNMLAADGTHLLDHAHDSIATRTIDQAVVSGGVNSLKRPVCANCNAGDVPYTAAAPDMMLASPWYYNGLDSLIAQKNTTVTANRYVMAGTGTNHAPFFPAFYIGDQTLGPLQFVMVSQSGIFKILKFSGSSDMIDLNNSGLVAFPQTGATISVGTSIQTTIGALINAPSGSRQAIGTAGQHKIQNSNVGGLGSGADAALYIAQQSDNSLAHGVVISQINSTGGTISFGTVGNYNFGASTNSLGIGVTPTASVHTAASTTSMASLRIPAGVAPTSPNEGDVYNDNSTHLARIWLNGAWVTIGGGGGSTPTIDQVLAAGSQAANATWTFGGFWTKLSGLRSDTNTIAHVLVKGADSAMREITPVQLATILPQDTTSYLMSVVGTTNNPLHDTVTLVGDQATPAAGSVYGTDILGNKGWQQTWGIYLPTTTGASNSGIASVTFDSATWTRSGRIIHLHVSGQVTTTGVGTALLTFSDPGIGNIGATQLETGHGMVGQGSTYMGALADMGTTAALKRITWNSATTSTEVFSVSIDYHIQ